MSVIAKSELVKIFVIPASCFLLNTAISLSGAINAPSAKAFFNFTGDPAHGSWLAYLIGAALIGAGWISTQRGFRHGGLISVLGIAVFGRSAPVLIIVGTYALFEMMNAFIFTSAHDEPSRTKRWEINLGRIFLIVVFSGIGFAAAEWILPGILPSSLDRNVFGIPQSDVRYPKPYVMFGGRPNARNLNRLGYPGPAPAADKPAGEFRIFVLGGSTVFNDNPSISSALQGAYHAAGMTHVKVFNFGVVSSVSGMDLARIVYEVSAHQPDFVIVYNGGNDLLNNWGLEDRPGYPFDFVYTENNPLLYLGDSTVENRGQYQGFTLFLLKSRLLRSLFRDDLKEDLIKRKLRPADLGSPGSPEWKSALVATYIKHLRLGHGVAKSLGAGFLGVLQPILFFKRQLADPERKLLADWTAHQWGRDQMKGVTDMRKMIVQAFDGIRAANGIDLLDLSEVFSDQPRPVFTDQIHITAEDRRAVAQELFKHLMGAGIGRPVPQ